MSRSRLLLRLPSMPLVPAAARSCPGRISQATMRMHHGFSCKVSPEDKNTCDMSAIEHTSSNMRVVKGESGEYTSKLVSTVSLKPGQVFASAHAMAPVAAKRYSTVQTGADCHAELNSDLLYMNHSCDPNVVLDVEHKIVAAAKDIRPGDAITFFYPSTEWEMDQPFECWCGAPNCLKEVKGAKFLDAKTLDKFAISKHIRRMVELRDAATVTLKQE